MHKKNTNNYFITLKRYSRSGMMKNNDYIPLNYSSIYRNHLKKTDYFLKGKGEWGEGEAFPHECSPVTFFLGVIFLIKIKIFTQYGLCKL